VCVIVVYIDASLVDKNQEKCIKSESAIGSLFFYLDGSASHVSVGYIRLWFCDYVERLGVYKRRARGLDP